MRRRSFLGGLIVALAAPAIIRTPGLLMPVRPVVMRPEFGFTSADLSITIEDFVRTYLGPAADKLAEQLFMDQIVYGCSMTRQTAELPFVERISPTTFLRHSTITTDPKKMPTPSAGWVREIFHA